jgi:hypothetical protein
VATDALWELGAAAAGGLAAAVLAEAMRAADLAVEALAVVGADAHPSTLSAVAAVAVVRAELAAAASGADLALGAVAAGGRGRAHVGRRGREDADAAGLGGGGQGLSLARRVEDADGLLLVLYDGRRWGVVFLGHDELRPQRGAELAVLAALAHLAVRADVPAAALFAVGLEDVVQGADLRPDTHSAHALLDPVQQTEQARVGVAVHAVCGLDLAVRAARRLDGGGRRMEG